jgi:hypothetical protein
MKSPKHYKSKYSQKGVKGNIDNYEKVQVKGLGHIFPCCRPKGAKKIPAADLPKTLADKLVVVGKKK